jgi:hypothetical protein
MREAPASRWSAEVYLQRGDRATWRTYTARGGFVEAYTPDWRRYRIPPKLVEGTDPLQFMLLEREPAIGEQLWIIDWHIVGSGPLFDLLRQPAARGEIEAAVESAFGDGERLIRVHRWELRLRGTNAADTVSLRIQEWLDEHATASWPSLCLAVDAELRRANCAAAAERTAELRPAAVREEAERLLTGWLAIPSRNAG